MSVWWKSFQMVPCSQAWKQPFKNTVIERSKKLSAKVLWEIEDDFSFSRVRISSALCCWVCMFVINTYELGNDTMCVKRSDVSPKDIEVRRIKTSSFDLQISKKILSFRQCVFRMKVILKHWMNEALVENISTRMFELWIE